MRGAWVAAGAIAAVVVGLLLWMLATRKPPPEIPADADHATVRRESGCLQCHGVGAPLPQPKNHPISQRCYQCHVRS